jgi:YD repeat-containing protein
MKKIVSIIGVVVIANTALGQGNYGYSCFDPIGKVSAEKFKGRIKSVKLSNSEGAIQVSDYDRNCRLIRQESSDTLGYASGITLFTYDSTGRLMKQEYTYKETRRPLDDQHFATVYTYDANGKLIQESRYKLDGKTTPIYRSRFVYDNEGRLIQKTWNATNQMWTIPGLASSWIDQPNPSAPKSSYGNFKYKYDTRHQLVEEACICDGVYENQTMTYKFSYRDTQLVSVSNGKQIDSFIYDGRKLFARWVMTDPYRITKQEDKYDSAGQLIEQCYEDGMLDKYMYDEYGNLSKIESYSNGFLYSVESFNKYDEHGNYWQSRLYFVTHNETRTTRVELIYYE